MSKIKECFISRWGETGYIMEADFSQLEIIALAELTKDPQLIADIISGIDLHRLRAAQLYRKSEADVTKTERTTAKMLSFQLQYGSGAANMAKQLKIPKEVASRFIKQYYDRYPIVRAWQDGLIKTVRERRRINTHETKSGLPAGSSYLPSATGRVYFFKEYDAPDWLPEPTAFSPTEIKNYPVQGYATGDIVPFVLGYLRRTIYNEGWEEKCLLINTVHDSIVLDIEEDMLYNIGKLVKGVMEGAPKILQTHFGIISELPFKADVSYGRNWLELKTLEL